jgi:hypothetical protein
MNPRMVLCNPNIKLNLLKHKNIECLVALDSPPLKIVRHRSTTRNRNFHKVSFNQTKVVLGFSPHDPPR